ncbi:MAG: hypothetical protein IJY31_05115 [Muribaculaceae bacterium]|nr:hypothetical protein [Muribaculaceae bacterium]
MPHLVDIFNINHHQYKTEEYYRLLFFCGYALRKEYEFLAADAKSRFPELEDKTFKKAVRQEFMMLYAKRLTTFFILLPIAYLAAFSPMPPKASNIIIALSLGIPAAVVVFYRARHKD